MNTLKDYFYELNKIADSGTNLYSDAQKLSPIFRMPNFTLMECRKHIPDLTYRKINDWDRKNLISGFRTNKQAGWRKFSTIDLIKLFIIADLRKFGMRIESIKSILNKISTTVIESKPTSIKRNKFLQLEYFIACSLLKEPILLLIDENKNVSFFQQNEAIKYHFKFDKAQNPVLILPFFLYVKSIRKTQKKKHE
jgi:DNA-binding transcriptional MerR regulator